MTAGRDDDASDREEFVGSIRTPDSAQQAILDVVSLKGLLRAAQALRRLSLQSDKDDFERALVRIINLNGAMARAILDDKQR